MASAVALFCQALHAQIPESAEVFHMPGKKRVHVATCKRLPQDPAELAKFVKLTLAEAKTKGLEPCSKCPGSTTPGRDEAGEDKAGDDAVIVLHMPGKKRVHLPDCKRLPQDPAELAEFVKMTLAEARAKALEPCSKCPEGTTPGKDNTAENEAEDGEAIVLHMPGKKRVHLPTCKRLPQDPAELAKFVKMTSAEAKAKGLVPCSKCPGSTTPGKTRPEGADGDLDSWVQPAPDHIAKKSFIPSRLAPLVSMGPGGRLVYKAYSERGDRILDWSHCGYRQSEVPIPTAPVVETLDPIAHETLAEGNLAYPSGPDSRERIQAAIDRVAARPADDVGMRGAVLLRRGTYFLNGGLRVPSGVVLRGEGDGEDGTVLIARSADGGGNAIEIGSAEARIEHVGEESSVRIADSYVPSGSDEIAVEDVSQFKVGDFVCVRKTVSQAWIDVLGMGERLKHIRGGKEGAGKNPWKPESYQFRHVRRITAVDGNSLKLDAVLPQSFAVEHGGGEVFKVDLGSLATHSGIESVRLVSNYDTTVEDLGKGSNFMNFRNGIVVSGASDSWVRDCTVMHVSVAAVAVSDHTRQVTVADCRCLKPVGPQRGGNRYAFSCGGGTLHLFYRCESEDGRHDFAGGSRSMGPFAFVRSTAVRGGQSEPHHRWGTGYLYDNVTTRDGVLAAINRGDSGSGHGWAAANTLFWNCDAKSIVVFDPETVGENNFAIGYKGRAGEEHDTTGLWYANQRAGYWATSREGKYFGFAVMGNGHIESPEGPVKPDSLFEQQLIDRIGKAEAGKVIEALDGERPTGDTRTPPVVLFEDSMQGDWQQKWFLDGKKATLEPREGGLYFAAGTISKNDDPVEYHAHHAVLWTKQVFEGDLRISFEMKRVDASRMGNTLLYIQAQGIGTPPYVEDIHAWRDLREVPDMSKYFTYMNLLSLSFRENLRCRRYPWRNMDLEWYPDRGLIEPMVDYDPLATGASCRVLVEKIGDFLRLRLYDEQSEAPYVDQNWDTSRIDEEIEPRHIRKGRIGLRHMGTKQFIYKNFRVEQL